MRSRWSAAVKCAFCLTAAAAGDWWVTVTAIYICLRVLGAYWGGLEMRVSPATPELALVWLSPSIERVGKVYGWFEESVFGGV